ncbi:unnamed protein product [Sphagnum balticum]
MVSDTAPLSSLRLHDRVSDPSPPYHDYIPRIRTPAKTSLFNVVFKAESRHLTTGEGIVGLDLEAPEPKML